MLYCTNHMLPSPCLVCFFCTAAYRTYLLPILFCHFCFLNDVFPFLVLLLLLKCFLIFPSQYLQATVAVDVCYDMKASFEHTILLGPQAYIHHIVEEVGPTMTPIKWLGKDVSMICRMCLAWAAFVDARTQQILLVYLSHSQCVKSCLLRSFRNKTQTSPNASNPFSRVSATKRQQKQQHPMPQILSLAFRDKKEQHPIPQFVNSLAFKWL